MHAPRDLPVQAHAEFDRFTSGPKVAHQRYQGRVVCYQYVVPLLACIDWRLNVTLITDRINHQPPHPLPQSLPDEVPYPRLSFISSKRLLNRIPHHRRYLGPRATYYSSACSSWMEKDASLKDVSFSARRSMWRIYLVWVLEVIRHWSYGTCFVSGCPVNYDVTCMLKSPIKFPQLQVVQSGPFTTIQIANSDSFSMTHDDHFVHDFG